MDSTLILKEKNIKITKARKCILEFLLCAEHAASAEEIFEFLKEARLEIDLSTVYRTLDVLECNRIVEKFDLGDGKNSYVAKKEVHKHTLHCSFCDKEIEIECPMLQIEELIKNKTGFTLMEHELKIKGICEDCKSKN